MTHPLVGKLQTIGTAWLFGLPAIVYLVLSVWIELGLPFPIEGFRVPQVTRFDGFDDNILPLHESFRHIASPVALVAIVIGLSFGLIRALRPLSPFTLTILVVTEYVSSSHSIYDNSGPGCLYIQLRLPFQTFEAVKA